MPVLSSAPQNAFVRTVSRNNAGSHSLVAVHVAGVVAAGVVAAGVVVAGVVAVEVAVVAVGEDDSTHSR